MTEIVIATLMKPHGTSGLQSHVRTVDEYLRSASEPVSIVSPFSARSPFVRPMFAARVGIRRFNRPAGVWWHQHWHAHYLESALHRHLKSRPDAVIYTQCPISAGVALRVRTTQPVVMVAHLNVSQADEWAGKGEIPGDGGLYRSIRSFEEIVLPKLDGIVYVSEFARSALEDRIPAIKHVPTAVVPNPVTAPAAEPTGGTADLITVGALEPRKNQGYLLEVLSIAARRGHRYSLSVIGSGPDRRLLQARVRDLGLVEQVRFLGYQADPLSLMAGHRLYCHTSMMENLPIALLEAMAAGLPVLAGAVGGVPEIVRPGVDGQFWPLDDPDAAAGVLIELMEDVTQLAAMAAAARVRARTEFSSQVVGRRLLNFLQETVIRTEKSPV
ncbi:glycosyltransferase involved in cell wall biosynthesis [Kribbella antiqua]|uniref:Glycosyltransferase involved in cell wall biosynthesis n=1 Tax=Kribbella antiqua TaxID=2512217 RepID=A0A4R2JCC2_9ACTN|nr:glycosyltransferase family 4 protein [Kribbella antiqua]TCO52065.1 glycosyltransferase involved in cell wall biosynthesis [Kribbella antiqua]